MHPNSEAMFYKLWLLKHDDNVIGKRFRSTKVVCWTDRQTNRLTDHAACDMHPNSEAMDIIHYGDSNHKPTLV